MPNTPVKNYILVHGAWHGSWCWHKVAKDLQALAHKVTTPDLPGHFYNKQDPKSVTLSSYVKHIEDLVHLSQYPVTLVGHSMAGVVITQVAENIPDKIEQLVYISAFIPKNKGSLIEEERQASIPGVSLEGTVDEKAGTILLKPSERIRDLFYGSCSEEDATYALSHLQPQPLQPFIDSISISKERFGIVPKLYIKCLQDKAIMPSDQHRMYTRTNCKVVSIDTDHSPFFSSSQQLVELISNAGHSRTSQS